MSPSAFSQLAFLLYNDQPPKSSSARDSSSRGHTKGEAWTWWSWSHPEFLVNLPKLTFDLHEGWGILPVSNPCLGFLPVPV